MLLRHSIGQDINSAQDIKRLLSQNDIATVDDANEVMYRRMFPMPVLRTPTYSCVDKTVSEEMRINEEYALFCAEPVNKKRKLNTIDLTKQSAHARHDQWMTDVLKSPLHLS